MVSYHNPPELPSSPAYSHAALIDGGRVIYVSGQQALDAQGQLVGRDDFARQAAQVFANIDRALAAAGADATNVVAINTHYVDRADLPASRDARAAFFAGRTAPAPTSTWEAFRGRLGGERSVANHRDHVVVQDVHRKAQRDQRPAHAAQHTV